MKTFFLSSIIGFCLTSVAMAVTPAAPVGCPATNRTFTNSTPAAISNSATVVSTIDVQGLPPSLWDVNLHTVISHTSNGELSMTLTSPAGTVVTISSRDGGSYDNVFNGTLWDDSANPAGDLPYSSNTGMETDHPYADGAIASPLTPEEPLGAFIGENPNGTWTLTILDAAAGNDGNLSSWTLEIASLPHAPFVRDTLTVGNPAAIAVPDNTTIESAVSISSMAGKVCGLRVSTNISHTWSSDLTILLRAPSGKAVTLSSNNGGSHNHIYSATTWFDTADPGSPLPYGTPAPLITSDYTFANLLSPPALAPEEALSSLIGDSPNGNWQLRVNDNVPGDAGTLDSWQLQLTTCDYPDTDGDLVADICDPYPGTPGNDAYGYRYMDSHDVRGPVFQWVDISASGAQLDLNDDTVHGPLALGLNFNMYGANYSEAKFSSNGFLTLDTSTTNSYFTNRCPLPDTNSAALMIAPMQDDYIDAKPSVPDGFGYHQAFPAGSCPYAGYPGACFIAQWQGLYRFGDSSTDSQTFETILFDNSEMLMQILDATPRLGDSATTGIQNLDRNIGLVYDADSPTGPLSCNVSGSVSDNLAIAFFLDVLDDDGVPSLSDNCPNNANAGQEDSDGDGVGDACEACASDPLKLNPGICGCGTPDLDSNANGVADCLRNQELSARFVRAEKIVKSLRVKKGKFTKSSKVLATELKALLSGMNGFVSSSISGLSVRKGKNIKKLTASAVKAGQKTLKPKTNFAANQKAARKALLAARKALV